MNYTAPPNFYVCVCQPGYAGNNCELSISTTAAISTTTPVPTTFSPCQDRDPEACAYYAQNNFCDYIYFLNEYKVSVPDYCPQSCQVCVNCQDSQENCVLWAALDLCSRLATIYPHPCRKSCKIC